jgi:hypothetical protein
MAGKNALVIAAIVVAIIAVTLGFYGSGINNEEIVGEGGGARNPNMAEVVIKSDGPWSAAIRDGESRLHSVDGFGDRSISIACNSGGTYSLVVQKSGGASGTLSVEVVKRGSVSKNSSTYSANGVISLSGTC